MHNYPLFAIVAISLILTGLIAPAFSDQEASSTGNVRVPAYTAYFEPEFDPSGLQLSVEKGITGWENQETNIVWYGQFSKPGTFSAGISLSLPQDSTSRLMLTIAKQVQPADVDDFSRNGNYYEAAVTGRGGTPIIADFGSVVIPTAGVYRFVLTGLTKSGTVFGDIDALLLSGPAAPDVHFSTEKSRLAPAVHLWYPAPQKAKIAWFYNEITPIDDPINTYYMVCGFTGGYFGIQVNAPDKRTILFSVWNSGVTENNPDNVPAENKVRLIADGKDVISREFGREGSGGQSFKKYMWKTGHTYRMLVSARPDNDGTIFSGYFFFPEKKSWELIASWKKPGECGWLRGLYSFNENFIVANGFQRRSARYGNQWILTGEGTWIELTTALYTHSDQTGNRPDRSGEAASNGFYLMNGGIISPSTNVTYQQILRRPASAKIPVEELPPVP